MNEQQSALAFARAYQLFSQIYRYGLDDDTAALLAIGSDTDAEKYGAAHYQLLVHNVYPYETIFLGDDGLLGGRLTENVGAFYHRIGFQPDSGETADHISNEFDALAYLCYAESDAIKDDVSHQIHRLRQLQRRFLDEHLLRWLPAFCLAVAQQEKSVYTEIVGQSFDLVCTHRVRLDDDLMVTQNAFLLPSPPDLITNEKTGLRDIARFLLLPAHTGFFLSVDDIRRIGATYRVPHGFGKRQQILTNLLRTASDYDLFTDIMTEFKRIASTWQDDFNAMRNVPETIIQVWMTRCQKTITTLDHIMQLANQQQITMDDVTTEEN